MAAQGQKLRFMQGSGANCFLIAVKPMRTAGPANLPSMSTQTSPDFARAKMLFRFLRLVLNAYRASA